MANNIATFAHPSSSIWKAGARRGGGGCCGGVGVKTDQAMIPSNINISVVNE